ncbi:60S ribosomal protein L23A, partial [Saguinus oedipus]
PKSLQLQRQSKYPWQSTLRRNKLDHSAIIKFPPTTESTMRKLEDNNSLVFIVKAHKHHLKQAVKKLCDTEVAHVNTLIVPDVRKKAYIQLPPDC